MNKFKSSEDYLERIYTLTKTNPNQVTFNGKTRVIPYIMKITNTIIIVNFGKVHLVLSLSSFCLFLNLIIDVSLAVRFGRLYTLNFFFF